MNLQYRIWSKKDKYYWYPEDEKTCHFYLGPNGTIFEKEDEWKKKSDTSQMIDVSKDYKIEFFSGVLDSNKQMIYQNDILEKYDGQRYTVVWKDNGWSLKSRENGVVTHEPFDEIAIQELRISNVRVVATTHNKIYDI